MTYARSLALIPLLACAEPVPGPGEPMTLTLEQRSGEGARGWSFAAHALVPAADADLTISSFDCGARGRWVSLHASDGLALCTAPPCSDWQIEVGGSDADVAIDDVIVVTRDEAPLAWLTLRGRTETPQDWYEEVPLRAFTVDLDVARP